MAGQQQNAGQSQACHQEAEIEKQENTDQPGQDKGKDPSPGPPVTGQHAQGQFFRNGDQGAGQQDKQQHGNDGSQKTPCHGAGRVGGLQRIFENSLAAQSVLEKVQGSIFIEPVQQLPVQVPVREAIGAPLRGLVGRYDLHDRYKYGLQDRRFQRHAFIQSNIDRAVRSSIHFIEIVFRDGDHSRGALCQQGLIRYIFPDLPDFREQFQFPHLTDQRTGHQGLVPVSDRDHERPDAGLVRKISGKEAEGGGQEQRQQQDSQSAAPPKQFHVFVKSSAESFHLSSPVICPFSRRMIFVQAVSSSPSR